VGLATSEAASRGKETLRGFADRFRFDEATKVRKNRKRGELLREDQIAAHSRAIK
jgi:hypothetical protein